jgi:aspartokinase
MAGEIDRLLRLALKVTEAPRGGDKIQVDSNVVKVSIIRVGMISRSDVAAKMFATPAKGATLL